MALNIRGQLTWGLGAPDEAEEFFRRTLGLPYIGKTAYRQQTADGVGRCHASRGELAEARRLLSDAATDLDHPLAEAAGRPLRRRLGRRRVAGRTRAGGEPPLRALDEAHETYRRHGAGVVWVNRVDADRRRLQQSTR